MRKKVKLWNKIYINHFWPKKKDLYKSLAINLYEKRKVIDKRGFSLELVFFFFFSNVDEEEIKYKRIFYTDGWKNKLHPLQNLIILPIFTVHAQFHFQNAFFFNFWISTSRFHFILYFPLSLFYSSFSKSLIFPYFIFFLFIFFLSFQSQ